MEQTEIYSGVANQGDAYYTCTINKHNGFFEGIESTVAFALLVVHYIALSIFSYPFICFTGGPECGSSLDLELIRECMKIYKLRA